MLDNYMAKNRRKAKIPKFYLNYYWERIFNCKPFYDLHEVVTWYRWFHKRHIRFKPKEFKFLSFTRSL